LDDLDILHRTKISKLIHKYYQEEHARIIHEAQHALGHISFTSDLWTDAQQRGYMAITLHFCAKDTHQRLNLHARL
ncbi:hypothetical protein WOLCODRAFT_46437, partial [Wolfiporia cocos MD-104 SS10]